MLVLPVIANAQIDSTQQKLMESYSHISDKAFRVIDNKYSLLQKLVENKTEKMLRRMQKKEADLQEQMQGKDSIKAKQLFANVQSRYQQLSSQLQSHISGINSNSYKEYFPAIDSMQTAMKFLKQGNSIPGISTDKLLKVTAISTQLKQLQASLQNANDAQSFINQREQQLSSQLMRYGLTNKLVGINKEAFYYQEQLAQYKSMLNDKEKLEETALATVQNIPAFQSFWQKYSFLSELFPQAAVNGVVLKQSGLQARSKISDIISKKVESAAMSGGSGGKGQSPFQVLESQLSQGQSNLNSLKDKINNLGLSNGGSSNMTMPDFVPNSQHTKRFLDRLELGFTIQNNQVTNYLPATSNLGLNIGYKINDKMTAGVGMAYLLGLGEGIQHIRLSNQGISFRSYIDIKAKGSFWITGGFEYSYMQQFASIQTIRNFDIWQKSALLGITKKYKIGKKQANIQLLYDFLHAVEIPQSNPIIFRIGFSL